MSLEITPSAMARNHGNPYVPSDPYPGNAIFNLTEIYTPTKRGEHAGSPIHSIVRSDQIHPTSLRLNL